MTYSSVGVLGLGNMGTALINALDCSGHPTTGWNRSGRSRERFERGVTLAANPVEACHASDLIISCLSSYEATFDVLNQPEVRDALVGRVLFQVSTGLPEAASELAAWAERHGIAYLDGKIAAVPGSIGSADAVIFCAGPRVLFERHLHVFKSLGGKPTYVGEDVAQATLADFAFLCFYFSSTVGLLYGTAFCQANGLDEHKYLNLVPSFASEVVSRASSFQRLVEIGEFGSEIQSKLNVDMKGARLLKAAAAKAGMTPHLADFLACFDAAVENGFGEHDTASLVDFFRGRF